MQIKLFTIPITDNGLLLEEMNRFMRAHKILETESQLVQNAHGATWCFCLKYIEQGSAFVPGASKEKVDYRLVLDAATFARFSKLRDMRKALAQEEAIPAYAVFTDEELASIASLETLTTDTLNTIKGIGEKRVEKYGLKVIEILKPAGVA